MATARKATAAKGKSQSKALVPANAPPARATTSRVYESDGSVAGEFVVEMWPITRVKPYTHNPRKNERSVPKVAALLTAYGWRQPLVVDEKDVLVVGHTRLLAALSLGKTHVPVHVAHGLTPAQVKAYRIADNRSHEDSEWDKDYLAEEIRELLGVSYEMELTAFEPYELRALTGETSSANDATSEWAGMPEFKQDDEMPHRRLIVNFASDAAVAKFAKAIGQTLSSDAKYIWFPAVKRDDRKARAYAAKNS
jgi:hypothetical protein